MFSRYRILLAIITFLFVAHPSIAQVRINEVSHSDVDFAGASKWVELHNSSSEAIDVSAYWLCNFPSYEQISNLVVLEGSATIPAGGFLVVAFNALGDDAGEVGLYETSDFSNSEAIVDYMEYGMAGHMRESVAVAAGVWSEGAFVSAAESGMSLALVGGGGVAVENWASAIATPGSGNPMDPDAAAKAVVDRFAEGTGTLFVRAATNGLPDAGEPIDFDQGPFITRGLGPAGQSVQYYNFDVMPRETAPIFALFREGDATPVEGQLNIVDVIPGDEGYNDFWHVHKVTVPSDYVANSLTSVEAIMASGFPIERTNLVVNCPVVPDGSTARLRFTEGNDSALVRGWYGGQIIYYFDFSERMLTVDPPADGHPMVPISPIYVAFNINPGEEGGGPPSGFVTEDGSDQTHNVVATLPQDEAYSPLWSVNPYDNADFADVHDLASAQSATILATGVALVNCPIVAAASDVSVEPISSEVPVQFELRGNYPNPFNPETTIEYALDEAGTVTLRVYDLLGRHVVDLVDSQQPSGVYRVTWNGRDAGGQQVATGMYVYRVSLNGSRSEARTMLMLK